MSRLPAELTRLAQGGEEDMRALLGAIAAQPPEADGGVGSLVVGGRSNLLSFPEYSDVDRAKELLSVLETREKVVSLLSQQGEMEISVRIGPETGMEETKDWFHRDGELPPERRNGQHDWLDWSDPNAVRQSAFRTRRSRQVDHGAA